MWTISLLTAVCLEWSISRALAAGATEDEITGMLLAIMPAIGLSRAAGAAPDLATALGYDIEAALDAPMAADGSQSGQLRLDRGDLVDQPAPRRAR